MKKHFTDSSSEILLVLIIIMTVVMVCGIISETQVNKLNEQIAFLEEEKLGFEERLHDTESKLQALNDDFNSLSEDLEGYKRTTVYIDTDYKVFHDYKDCSGLTRFDKTIVSADCSECLFHGYVHCLQCLSRSEADANQSHVTITKIVEDENTEALRKLQEKYSNDNQ